MCKVNHVGINNLLIELQEYRNYKRYKNRNYLFIQTIEGEYMGKLFENGHYSSSAVLCH